MKIYQLHKYGGEWEDAYDHIIGTYLNKEKAEAAMAERHASDRRDAEYVEHCGMCPYWNSEDETTVELRDKMLAYCDHSDIHCDGNGELVCNASLLHYDYSNLRIEEVDVEEDSTQNKCTKRKSNCSCFIKCTCGFEASIESFYWNRFKRCPGCGVTCEEVE